MFVAAGTDAERLQPIIGNGQLGALVGADGFVADRQVRLNGLYLLETLLRLPAPGRPTLTVGGEEFGEDVDSWRNYSQELNIREGVVTTRLEWRTSAGPVGLRIECAVMAGPQARTLTIIQVHNRSKLPVAISVRAPSFPQRWQVVTTVEDGRRGAVVVQPPGEKELLAAAYFLGVMENPGMALLPPGEEAAVFLIGGFAARDSSAAALAAAQEAAKVSGPVSARMVEHRAAWRERWERTGIEIEGDPEAQRAVRSMLYHLWSSIGPEATGGVAPMGLIGDGFNGHVFWDMDSWLLPAMLPQRPDLARAMLEYRYRTLPGARENAKAAGQQGAAFAWESGRTGRETIGHMNFSHGRHINGDIALAVWQYFRVTGDKEWLASRGWPLLRETANYWLSRVVKEADGYHIKQVSTPDESAGLVDDSAWTNYVARRNLEIAAEVAQLLGRRANTEWTKVAAGIVLLRDNEGRIREHANFAPDTKTIKQADVLLLVHPGELEMTPNEMAALYDYYAPLASKVGPAMTDAIHAIVAARLGRKDEALARFRSSYQPFLREPFHTFSEKRTRNAVYFLTGAAGSIEAVLYGFAGLRLQDDGETGHPLADPLLPNEWTRLTIRGIQWKGRAWDLTVERDSSARWTERR